MDVEIRDIPGFADYGITRNGKVWSRPRRDRRGAYVRGRWLKSGTASNGYLTVCIRDDSGERKTRCVHELVLLSWAGPRPNGFWARHLDGNKRNNTVSNLCWDTASENIKDNYRHGLLKKGGESHFAKLTESDVWQILKDYHLSSFSAIQLAEKYGLNRRHVHAIVAGRSWKETWKRFWKNQNERVVPLAI